MTTAETDTKTATPAKRTAPKAAAAKPAAKKPAAAKPQAAKPASEAKPAPVTAQAETPAPVPLPAPAVAPAPAVTATAEVVPPVVAQTAQKAGSDALKNYEDAVAHTKENLDAMLKAGQTLAEGLQDLGKSVFSLTQEAVQDGVSAARQLAQAKSLREAVDLQASHAKTQIQRLMGEGGKLTEAAVKLAEEAYAPVQARIQATVDKLTKRP